MLGANDAEPVSRGVVAIHFALDGVIEVAIIDGAGSEEHFGDCNGFTDALGGGGNGLHAADAARAAMVGEDGPIEPTQILLEPGQVSSGGRDSLFGDEALIAEEDLVRHLLAHGPVGDFTAFFAHGFAFSDLAVAGGIDEAQAHGFGGGGGDLHDAFRPSGALRHWIAEAFEVADGFDERGSQTAPATCFSEDFGEARALDAFGSSDGAGIAQDGEGLGVHHELDALVEQLGRHLTAGDTDAGEAVGRGEVLRRPSGQGRGCQQEKY